MFTGRRKSRTPSNGYSLPNGSDVGDPFGPRPFAPHTSTVGYDYDWHRGVDFPGNENDPIKAPMGGSVVRRHYTHFLYWHDDALNEFTVDDVDNAIDLSINDGILSLAWDANLVPTSNDFLGSSKVILNQLLDPDSGDLDLRLRISNPDFDGQGAIGLAIYDISNSEYAAIDYDSSTVGLLCHAVDADGVDATTNGESQTPNQSVYWLRLFYDQSADELLFQYGTDGYSEGEPTTWDTVSTWSSPNWTQTGYASMQACFYFRRTTEEAVNLSSNLWVNLLAIDNKTIGRFGNWVTILRGDESFIVMHMSHIYADYGPIQAGEVVGTVGKTGFDSRSGLILNNHVHIERIYPGAYYFYENDAPVNPLAPGILPRANVNNNISAVLTEGTDPNDDDCHILTVTTTREDNDFDLNLITLTGSDGTRTVNFNTREGLNPGDSDVPDYDGVYIIPQDFDDEDTDYVVAFYFQKDVVGSVVLSWELQDTEGTTLVEFDSGLDLSNALIWLETDSGVTTGTGTNVVSWVDKISGADFVNAADDATCPSLVAGDINGYPSIEFRRADSTRLIETTLAGTLWRSGLYPAYVIALFSPSSITTGQVNGHTVFGISGGNSPSGASGMLTEVASDSAYPIAAGVRSVLTGGAGNTLTTAEFYTVMRQDEWQSVNSGIAANLTSRSITGREDPIPGGNHRTCGDAINCMSVGCYLWTQIPTQFADGKILSIMAFDQEPTTEQAEALLAYWEEKYDFTIPDGAL